MLEGYRLFEWGLRSAERLEKALSKALCGHGQEKPCDELAILAPWLQGGDPRLLELAVDEALAWHGLKWAYKPQGKPPDSKRHAILLALQRQGAVLDEQAIRKVLGYEEDELV